MTKRVAQHQMTKENCLNEDEQEEAGYFEQAAGAKLLNRSIRKAKRRLPDGKNGVPSSPFSQFAGFVGSKAASAPMFNFGTSQRTSNGKNLSPNPTDNSGKQSLPKPNLFSDMFSQKKNNSVTLESSSSSSSERSKPTSANNNTQPVSGGKSESTFLEKLKELNVCFLSWVQEHMNKNGYCDFTPVCMDYINHVKTLERPAPEKTVALSKAETTKRSDVPSPPIASSLKKDSPKKVESVVPPLQKQPSVSFSFLAKKDDQSTALKAQPKPFTFSASVVSKTAAPDTQSTEADGEDNYVPPKNEFQEVKEEGALYSKRCKLFYKKEGNFVDKGIGTLYIKNLEDKMQLLVRADTSLGNILLNILLSSSLPTERVGKNNVLIVCVPSPPLDPKATPEPTPLLFRVKTGADADELLEKLNHFKSSTQC